MSLSDNILEIWAKSEYVPPSVPLIYSEGEFMAVIDDSDNMIRFMSYDGQISIAIKTMCNFARTDEEYGLYDAEYGSIVYSCGKVTPILCSPSKSASGRKDMFVLKNIAPLLE